MGQTIRKVIEERGGRSLGERTEIYSAARTSVSKATNDEPAIMADLDQVIDEIEASYTTKPEIKEASRGGATRALAMLGAGAVLGGAAAAGIMMFGLRFQQVDPVAATFMRQYSAAAPLLQAAVDYLHKVADTVVEMQKSDPAALEAKASKYVSLRVFDPELAKEFPPSVPPGSGILVRADRDDYKILFNWTLCGTARVTRPEMVDPVRNWVDVPGCPYFGLWTPGAAKW